MTPCPECRGRGWRGVVDGERLTCPGCHGSGDASPAPARRDAAREFPADEMDEALNDGFAAVARWQRAQQEMTTAVAQATEALREAMKRSPVSLREIARRSRLSPSALSEVANGHLDNLSSHATWRVLEAIRAACVSAPGEGDAPAAPEAHGRCCP